VVRGRKNKDTYRENETLIVTLTEHKMAFLIRDALVEQGITQAAFCKMVGVSTKHLNLVLNGKATARSAQLDYWAFVLGKKFSVTLD